MGYRELERNGVMARAILNPMKILIANWKMAPETPKAAASLAKATATIAKNNKKKVQVIACVPHVYLSTVRSTAKTLALGAQDVSASTTVASTGHVSAIMLKSGGAAYSIVGHSECRAVGDTNESVKAKITGLLAAKVMPILCVGEKERDAQGWYLSTIKDQIESACAGITKPQLKQVIIAYEPVWAIGEKAAREATPAECHEMVLFIRKLLADLYDEKSAKQVPILYGGSVSEDNAAAFVTDGGATGLLVGRVSLEPKRFAKIAQRISL